MEALIKVLDRDGGVKAAAKGEDRAVLAWKGQYEEGDRIVFQVPETGRFYVIRVDDTMDEAFVYMTREQLVYDIPFEEKKASYNPKAFTGERHYLTLRRAHDYVIAVYKNLA